MTDIIVERAAAKALSRNEGSAAIARPLPRWMKHFPFHVAVIVSALLLWQLASDRWVSSLTISSPAEIWEAAKTWSQQGYLQFHTWHTFQAVFVSFVLGSVLAFAVAVLFIEVQWLGRFGEPYMIALSVIPPIALIPIFIIWLGLGLAVKIVMGVLATFFIVFITSYQGLRSIDSNLLELARIFSATRWQRLFKFRVWAALPFFMSGAKLALPKAALGVLVAEFLTGNRGLGYAILRAGNNYDMGGFFVGVITLTVVVFFLSSLLLLIERAALSWVPSERL